MYRIVKIEDRIRIPPELIGKNVKDSVKASASKKYEGTVDPKIGFVLSVIDVEEVREGKIIPNDPGIHYDSVLKLLTFKPEIHEMVYGIVIENAEFGAFIRIGPIDGLVHISQLMDDYVSFDSKNSVFIGKESKKSLKEGDKVRARIISISSADQKIGLTMRQQGLGALHWLEAEKRRKKHG